MILLEQARGRGTPRTSELPSPAPLRRVDLATGGGLPTTAIRCCLSAAAVEEEVVVVVEEEEEEGCAVVL